MPSEHAARGRETAKASSSREEGCATARPGVPERRVASRFPVRLFDKGAECSGTVSLREIICPDHDRPTDLIKLYYNLLSTNKASSITRIILYE